MYCTQSTEVAVLHAQLSTPVVSAWVVHKLVARAPMVLEQVVVEMVRAQVLVLAPEPVQVLEPVAAPLDPVV